MLASALDILQLFLCALWPNHRPSRSTPSERCSWQRIRVGWRTPLTLRNALLTVLVVLELATFGRAIALASAGGDFQIYCAAIRVAEAGGDPYDAKALELAGGAAGLPMTSPGLILPLLQPVCASGGYAPVWLLTLAVALALAGALDYNRDWFLLAAILLAGFDTARWMLLTGNIAVFELLFGSVGIAALGRRDAIFSVGVGAATFLKITPAAYCVLPLVHGTLRCLPAAIGVLATYCALHAVYFLVMPGSFGHYWGQMLGGFQGFFQAEAIYGGGAHPSVLSLLSDGSSRLTGRSWPAIPIYMVGAAAILIDLLRLRQTRPRAAMVPLWGLGLLVVMPRLKPYAFGLGLVPLYLGAKALPPHRQALLLLISCVLPDVLRAAGDIRILGYGQLVALIGAYFIVRHSGDRQLPA